MSRARTLASLTVLVVGVTASVWSVFAAAQSPSTLASSTPAPAAQTPPAGQAAPAGPPAPASPLAAKGSRCFEMRTYYAAPGKIEALHARFRDHTVKLFTKHGMTNVGYWIPRDKPDTIVYILAYPSREARDKSWDAFRADPDWVNARKASEANGPLTTKVESVFMDATDYSPMK
jgi:NIPSNAP